MLSGAPPFAPIAVIGMGGLFPQSPDLERYWQNIVAKVDASRDMPPDRCPVPPGDLLDTRIGALDRVYTLRGCYTEDVPSLDELGLASDLDLLNQLDPLFSLVLHAGVLAFRQAETATLDLRRAGIVMANIVLPTRGASLWAERVLWRIILENAGREKASHRISGAGGHPLDRYAAGMPASLLGRALGFGGGAFTLDAACASSLYAIKLACDELQSGRADLMLAGGASRPDPLFTQMGFCQLRALSPSGRCSPFDAKADGLIVGEGAGMFLLKRLADAEQSGDEILGVIRGIGLSNDRGGSLLAPDSEGQLRAMRAAYEQAGWNPGMVDLIECHATGTTLGDATEFRSLTQLFEGEGARSNSCALGSVKSNIGHLLTAAGAASLTKVLLAFRHRILPPSAHFEKPSPRIKLDGSPFRIQASAEEWEARGADTPRRAAVSAFGFGGINAHLLVEERNHTAARKPANIPMRSVDASREESPVADSIPVAIIGMAAHFGKLNGLRAFQEAVFNGELGGETADQDLRIKKFDIPTARFKIPPKELGEMLPQQLLMLEVTRQALEDAGEIASDEASAERLNRTGVYVGISLDMRTTDYHLRWNAEGIADFCSETDGSSGSDDERNEWIEAIREAAGSPLTANGTIGGLGGMVASRVAREFRVGGPSFTISSEETSGLHALEIGVRMLQRKELDRAIVGGVDFGCDLRASEAYRVSRTGMAEADAVLLDEGGPGSPPGEGAAALILKRLDEASRDGDRIYGVIRGLRFSSGAGDMEGTDPDTVYARVLKDAYQEAGINPASVSYIEASSGDESEEASDEVRGLSAFLDEHRAGAGSKEARRIPLIALSSVKSLVGNTGAVSGLAGVIKASLALYHNMLPAERTLSGASDRITRTARHFHVLREPQYWVRNRSEVPRVAGVSCIGMNGESAHIVLEEHESEGAIRGSSEREVMERRQPLGARAEALFVVEHDDPLGLLRELEILSDFTQRSPDAQIENLARGWWNRSGSERKQKLAIGLIARNSGELLERISIASKGLTEAPQRRMDGLNGIFHSPEPLGGDGEIAFVFPGSGNAYLGMGLRLSTEWPEIARELDRQNQRLFDQWAVENIAPRLPSWRKDWEKEPQQALLFNHNGLIAGHVSHSIVVTDILRSFGVEPKAVIGYSLGESAGHFAMRVWKARDEMLGRMERSRLFVSELVGPCDAARRLWRLAPDEEVGWTVGVVDRSSDEVRLALQGAHRAYLLIVNAPRECVIGGQEAAIRALIRKLGCAFVPLEGISTVHCEICGEVGKEYRDLHLFDTSPRAGVRFYSGAWGRSFEVTRESAADSILAQAVSGINFPKTINQSYADGARIFVEVGPRNSCSRMIDRILEGRPHLARSACMQNQNDLSTVLRLIGALAAERVPITMDRLYGLRTSCVGHVQSEKEQAQEQEDFDKRMTIVPPDKLRGFRAPKHLTRAPSYAQSVATYSNEPISMGAQHDGISNFSPWNEPDNVPKQYESAAAIAHRTFLEFSHSMAVTQTRNVERQLSLLAAMIGAGDVPWGDANLEEPFHATNPEPTPTLLEPVFDRDACLEFAIGDIADVLGGPFASIDTHPTRVRLPVEPLMFVDRVVAISGEPGSLGGGAIVTEHDVLPDAWYLDQGRIPTGFAVEAGQADLFLSAYLGIDFKTRGLAKYRLLDAQVVFHRGLPEPGSTVRYEITIEKFIRQGDTYLFFFHFDGFIGPQPVLSMREGCAGFFTDEQLTGGRGLVLTDEELAPEARILPNDWTEWAPMERENYGAAALDALRSGDLAGCFGSQFENLPVKNPLRLPGGSMKLIDRVVLLDPTGGRYGLGLIRAEIDIHPEDWFLTCHFVDDPVMPGTLMYESCLHALRVFLMRMGWIAEEGEAAFEPKPGIHSQLRCRGQVLPTTRKAEYEIHLKELGYDPAPFAIADAIMFADGRPIVWIADMSVQLSGVTRERLRDIWRNTLSQPDNAVDVRAGARALITRDQIVEFAKGLPSKCFGDAFRVFDHERFLARLPSPPFLFLDRIMMIEAVPMKLEAGGWIEAQLDIHESDWFLRANRQQSLPYSVILEFALQTCGFLAAYMGSALTSPHDLHFRNLDGSATLHENLDAGSGPLTARVRTTSVAKSGGMLIERFEMEVRGGGGLVFEGETSFGFFSKESLAQQVGIRGAKRFRVIASDSGEVRRMSFEDECPMEPADARITAAPPLVMPAKAYRMIDSIEIHDGVGEFGLGFVRGRKRINPGEWFFQAHFFRDPVWPGSLGLEAFLQAVKAFALDRWGDSIRATHQFAPIALGVSHSWSYRGQVLRENREVIVEAVIAEIDDANYRILADGFLIVDDLVIYEMKSFGIEALPIADASGKTA